MGHPPDYKYDVFISYHEDPDHLKMVRDIFLRHFRWYLSNSKLGRSPVIYFDKEVNQPGDKWERVIKNALARSKILVAFWSIPYFESEWCRKECAIMLHREERLGYLDQERQGSLIVPVRVADGNTYPEVVRKFQQFNFWDYTGLRRGSGKEAKLEREIRDWAEDVADRILQAPPWDPDWLSEEWLDEPARRWEESRRLWPPNLVEFVDRQVENMGYTNG